MLSIFDGVSTAWRGLKSRALAGMVRGVDSRHAVWNVAQDGIASGAGTSGVMRSLPGLAVSLWLGAMAFFAFFVAPAAFATLEREAAGRLVSAMFPRYYQAGVVLGLLALAGCLGRSLLRGWRGLDWLPLGLVTLMLALTLYAWLGRAPGGPRGAGRHAPDGRGPDVAGGAPVRQSASAVRCSERRRDARRHGGPRDGGDASTMKPFEPLGLDHVVLRVRDQDASRRFYTEVLGCTLDHVNERISLVQLRFGEQLLDLLPGERGPDGSGMDHVCLSIRCADLRAVQQALTEQGVALEGDVVERRGAFGTGPSLYLRDPDGYRVELKPR